MATVEYTRSKGKRLTYTINADRHGGYDVLLDGKLIKQMHIGDSFGKSRFGSKKREAEAVDAAKAAIEMMLTDDG